MNRVLSEFKQLGQKTGDGSGKKLSDVFTGHKLPRRSLLIKISAQCNE